MDYSKRTDNRYLPNTKEGNEKLCWWLHWFSGENQFVILIHLINLEKQHKRETSAKQSNTSNKDNVPKGVLD
jgi:hypothetical protein